MSEFDSIRKRKKQGDDARQRVMDRVYSPKASTESESEFSSIRNRKVNLQPIAPPSTTGKSMTELKQTLPAGLTATNPIESSTLMKAINGDTDAIKTYQQYTGVNVGPKYGPPAPTQYEINKAKNASLPAPIRAFSDAMNYLVEGNPVGRFIDRPFHDIAESMGLAQNIKPTTGNKIADKTADILSIPLSAAVPIAPGVAGANLTTGPLNIAEGAVASRAGQAATNALAKGIGKAGVSPQMSSRIAREALVGAGAGAIGNAEFSALSGNSSLSDIGKAAGEGALFGGAIGAAAPALGRVGQSILAKMKKTPVTRTTVQSDTLALPSPRNADRIERANGTILPRGTEPIADSAGFKPLALPEPSVIQPTTARVARGKSLNDVLEEIKPIVDERMTPPYENPTELARWVKSYLGPEYSLNEVKKLSYDDLGQLAEEIRRTTTVYDTAVKVAAERGYDLEKLLNPTSKVQPGLAAKARETQRMRDVVGAPPVVRPQGGTYQQGVFGEAAAPRTRYINQGVSQPNNLIGRSSRSGGGGTGNPFDITDEEIPNFLRGKARRNVQTPEPQAMPEATIPEQANVEPAETMKQDLFTDFFGNQGVGIAAGGGSSRRINQGPLTTEDQIVNSPLKSDLKGNVDAVKAQMRAAYQNLVDRLSPLKKVSEDTYEAAMDSTRANNIANTIIRDKFVTPEGKVVGEGLNNIFKKVARGQDRSFIDYLTLRHAENRVGRGERVYAENLGMTFEKITDRIKMYEKRHPGFKNIAAEWDGFWDNLRRYYGVDEGLISKNMYNYLTEENPHYSPMRRQFSKSEKPGRNFLRKTTSSSFSGQKAPLQKVSPTGSVRDIVDPRRSAIEQVGSWVNASMRNRVMQSMVDAIKRDPESFKGVAEIVRKPKDKTDLNELLKTGGTDDFVEALDDDFKNIFKTTRVDQDNIVRAMVDGEPVYLQVHDPEIVKTLVGMGPQASNVLINVMSAFSNATKRGATGVFAPVFAVKGATMDLVQSAIQAKNPPKQAAYTVYAILSGIGDRLRIPGLKNLSEEYRRSGGEFSAAIKGDRPLNKNIREMTRYPLLSPQGVAKGVKKTFAAPFKTLEAIGDIAENAPRMAAYKLEMDRLGGERTPENVRQAMSQAREITTNFSRKGAFTRDIEAFIPYNNAAIQGTVRVVRVLRGIKNNPVKTAAAIGTLAVIPKMIEYLQFADDPDYQNLPARERYRFLFVNKNEDGTFTKIPMEPAYNSFGELTIEALRRFKDNDPTAFKGAADALANAWLPPAVTGALQGVTQDGGAEKSIAGAVNSTVFAPYMAVTANQSFTGAPIVSQSLANRSPEFQYDEKTSSIAKQIGRVTNMSPMKVDYLIRSYGGDPARLLLPLTSEVGQGNVRNTVLKNFIVDPQYTTTLTDDFYKAKDKLNQAYYDNKEADVPLPAWYNEDLRKTLNSTAKGSVSKQLSNLRDQKKAINADKSLSSKEKTQQLRDIQEQINNIYIDINSILSQNGIID